MSEFDEAQSRRFTALDPMIAAESHVPEGETLTAALPDGTKVRGVLVRSFHGPESMESLWGPRDNFELTPLLGDTGAAGMDALLRVFADRVREEDPGADSVRTVMWPSRDVEPTHTLLAHGFAALNHLAVRPRPAAPPSAAQPTPGDGPVIRRAAAEDVGELVGLALEELRYSAASGPSVVRENSAALLERGLRRSIFFGGSVWIAELDGRPAGLADCGTMPTTGRSPLNGKVHSGRWGYVLTLSVAPWARGRGVGAALTREAHQALDVDGVNGTVLFFSPTNPLSSVFWPRRGYRPVWTVWEARPAA
ncbi:GNAT family N-acetyltransferase [Amycolatopsis antarctica]|uniref:GNAT family N-acetyltransferase n=1 Tax=Amycolatopsis antarctica TaxID=1854586 RepID=A0A263D3Y3_9PSEU|nr:GNAT family N-acetyltransferase [Amycolatopsis antarctica]OZM72166.1 GNAT family N-acetyltransferase [Amycolatopsis antarctica]